jgi:hypothetical protein
VLDRHRLLVIGQPIGRRPAEPAQRGIQAGDHARQGLVPDRQHHPEPAPRQPGAKQQGRPPADHRPAAVVPLQPHPRLGHPGPVDPPPAGLPGPLGRSHRSPGRALRPLIAERDQLVVGDISAQLAAAALHPLLQLGPIGVHHHGPGRRVGGERASPAGGDVAGDGVMIAAGQLGGVPVASGQVERFKDLHDLLGRLHCGPSSGAARWHAQSTRGGAARRYTPAEQRTVAGEISWPPLGKSYGRQRGAFWPPTGRFSWPPTNQRPHPYQRNAGNRCADGRFPRSRATVRVKVMRSIRAVVCVLKGTQYQ